jgi:hypothetical protein
LRLMGRFFVPLIGLKKFPAGVAAMQHSGMELALNLHFSGVRRDSPYGIAAPG